jgi:release factor glutamine methyltransferase
MSASPSADRSADTSAALVARLRAAGCVFAEDEARLLLSAAQDPAALEAMVDQRVAGVPLEYVLGWAEFCGLRIAVDATVFVPRQRTEFLVLEAAALLRAASGRPGRAGRMPVVLDMCCGSGAIGAALAAVAGDIELYATDLDPAAVRCARRNVAGAGGRVFQGDLFEPLPTALRGRFDIIAANAPYVPTGAIGMMPPEARLHERLVALDGGADGLDVVRRVAGQARYWLAPGGHLLVEANERQAPSAADAFARNGLTTRIASSDEFGATLVIGTVVGTKDG